VVLFGWDSLWCDWSMWDKRLKTDKWDFRFLDLAKFISEWSKDPSTKVGAVIADRKKRIISVGYNGLPIGVDDSKERLENREVKYNLIIHAERNAILFAQRDLEGCSLYTWPFMPCSSCASIIVQAGIKRCIAPENHNPRWKDNFELSRTLFIEGEVELLLLDYKEK